MATLLKLVRYGVYGVAALAAMGFALHLLFPLPALEPRGHSRAIGYQSGPLADGARRMAADHPGLSGVHMLNDGRSAFAARIALARAAVHTLDVQYYIWKGDLSGSLLLDALRAAAARGVRVRLLLDDNGIAGLDEPLAAFDQFPNVEVRIYNPFTIRKPKLIGYLADFPRLNRRMHNKSFTADGAATVIGGDPLPHARLLGSGSGSGGSTGSGPVLRSSASMLHAKTFAVDGRRIFVGSFNFDPRSMHLNTELGFLIDSPTLASRMNRAFAGQIPARSYQVILTPAGTLQWVEHDHGRTLRHDVEPGTTWSTRTATWLLSHLPIEWLL